MSVLQLQVLTAVTTKPVSTNRVVSLPTESKQIQSTPVEVSLQCSPITETVTLTQCTWCVFGVLCKAALDPYTRDCMSQACFRLHPQKTYSHQPLHLTKDEIRVELSLVDDREFVAHVFLSVLHVELFEPGSRRIDALRLWSVPFKTKIIMGIHFSFRFLLSSYACQLLSTAIERRQQLSLDKFEFWHEQIQSRIQKCLNIIEGYERDTAMSCWKTQWDTEAAQVSTLYLQLMKQCLLFLNYKESKNYWIDLSCMIMNRNTIASNSMYVLPSEWLDMYTLFCNAQKIEMTFAQLYGVFHKHYDRKIDWKQFDRILMEAVQDCREKYCEQQNINDVSTNKLKLEFLQRIIQKSKWQNCVSDTFIVTEQKEQGENEACEHGLFTDIIQTLWRMHIVWFVELGVYHLNLMHEQAWSCFCKAGAECLELFLCLKELNQDFFGSETKQCLRILVKIVLVYLPQAQKLMEAIHADENALIENGHLIDSKKELEQEPMVADMLSLKFKMVSI